MPDVHGLFLGTVYVVYKCQESEQTDIYMDNKTQIGFWHDFPHAVPLKDSFSSIKKKYNRRIERLYDEINKAKDILFFRICTIRPQSGNSITEIIYSKSVEEDQKIVSWLEDIRKQFQGKNISLLEVSVFNEPHEYRRRELQEGLTRIEVFSDKKYEWEGDPKVFRAVLADRKLKNAVILKQKMMTLKFHIQKFIINLGAKLGIRKYRERKKWLKNRFNR